MPNAVSTAELIVIRAEAETLMPNTAQIKRYTQTNTGTGWTNTETIVATVKCRLAIATHRPATEIDVMAKEAVRNVTFWIIRFPHGTDVRDKDRITIDGTNTFELVGVQAGRAFDTVVRCMAVRLN